MTMTAYILVRQLPGTGQEPGEIKAHNNTFTTVDRAAQAAGRVLRHNAGLSRSAVKSVIDDLSTVDGITWTYVTTGYRFRILEADYTADGAPILPGLRVRNNDNWWGIVHAGQFFAAGPLDPGGQFFDHWYYVHREGDEMSGMKYNGERLFVKELTQ